jgi:hypothetical protein
MSHKLDLLGNKYGRLTLVQEAAKRGKNRYWMCQCDCGTIKEVSQVHLVHGKTVSCGCKKIENIKSIATSHGMSKTTIYRKWQDMVRRCTDPSRPKYKYYGGRGISVCERWMSFENFFSDMGMPPEELPSIDRINKDGNYCPGNCRWANYITQQNNKRTSVRVDIGGVSKSPRQWSDETGIPVSIIHRNAYRGKPQIEVISILNKQQLELV